MPHPGKATIINQGLKKCCRCGIGKPPDDFKIRRASKDGRNAACRDCMRSEVQANSIRANKVFDQIQGEVWLPIKGWEGSYEISNMGRFKSLKRIVTRGGHPLTVNENITSGSNDGLGYKRVMLCRGTLEVWKRIHELVATAFIENPENKPTVNHKRGKTLDNRDTELEWATYSEQHLHAYRVLGRKTRHGNKSKYYVGQKSI